MTTCAIILAGGQGTRLRPVINSTPKALAKINGRPFIYFLLDQLKETGIKLIVMSTGFGSLEIERELGNWYRDMKIVYSQEAVPLGTGGALRKAAPYVNSSDVLVLNGDSFCQSNLSSFLEWYQSRSVEAAMIVTKTDVPSAFGQLCFSSKGKVESFIEKRTQKTNSWINAGIYLFSQNILSTINEDRPLSLEKNLFPQWTREGRLWAYPAESPFIDIGTPESFAQAQTFFGAFAGV